METRRHRILCSPTGVLVSILGLLCFPVGSPGQTVEGRVIDLDDGGISGATISFYFQAEEVVARVVSDDDGYFRVGPIQPGQYVVMTERLGFKTTESIISLLGEDNIVVDLRMDLEAIPVEPIVVRASSRPSWELLEPPGLWSFFERRDYHEKLGLGQFLTETELKPLAGSNPAHAVAQLSPFLQALSHRDRPSTILLRGRRGCKPLIWIDGHLVSPRQVHPTDPQLYDPYNSPRGGRPPPSITSREDEPLGSGEEAITDFILFSEIRAIEVYRGSSDTPGEFRSGLHPSDCGAVVIWSKRR